MGKGSRHRRERREAVEREESAAREAAAEKARRDAFFATWSADDGEQGPAFPCPDCGSFDRRWASPEERSAALVAHDALWGLAATPDDERRVAVCTSCGSASVT